MPVFTFQDSDTRPQFEVAGDYPLRLLSFEAKISAKGGNDMYELKWETPHGVWVYDSLVFTDKAWWKIDTFLKAILPSFGKTPPKKGTPIDLNEKVMKSLLGGVALSTLNVEEQTEGANKGKKRNTIAAYLKPTADTPKATPIVAAEEKPADEPF